MNRIREHLQKGTARRLLSWTCGLLAAILTLRAWPSEPRPAADILSSLQKAAFVTMAFGVTAYNLRTRVVDLLLKNTYKPDQIAGLSQTAQETGRRLTGLVLLFTLTSLLMGIAGFLNAPVVVTRSVGMAIAFLFGYSVISFIYILFAFERLEKFILDQAVKATREKEIERLTTV